MNTLELTKNLIAIPSYVGVSCNEKVLGEFVFSLLQKTDFKLEKQIIDDERFNIIATKGIPKVWLCGHIDTVEPKNKEQLTAKLVEEKLYGLGAIDMKAGVAIILSIALNQNLNNIGLLFYCDEEYSFAGMKKFIEKYNFPQALSIFTEPTNLGISNAIRGLVEFDAVVKGKTGHAARPWEGVNVITNTGKAIEEFSKLIKKESTKELGFTTCTISKIKAGTQIGKDSNKILYASGTNSIPDTAEISVDIRIANTKFRAKDATMLLNKTLKKYNCYLESFTINADYGALFTSKKELRLLEQAIKTELKSVHYLKAIDMGYGDGQMLNEATGNPVICFGPGPAEQCHKKDEYVDINSVEKAESILVRFLKMYN